MKYLATLRSPKVNPLVQMSICTLSWRSTRLPTEHEYAREHVSKLSTLQPIPQGKCLRIISLQADSN